MSLVLERKAISVEAYHMMIEAGILTEEDKVELLNGDIIQMSSVGSHHIGQVSILTDELLFLLRKKAVILSQSPIKLDNNSEPEPDVTVLKFSADYYVGKLAEVSDIFFVIEVAKSTLQRDREVKIPLYAQAGIPAYWIVNLVDNMIEVYSLPQNGIYRQTNRYMKGDSLLIPGFDISLKVDDILL